MTKESLADRDPTEILLELIDAWRERQPNQPSREEAIDYMIEHMGLDPGTKEMLLRYVPLVVARDPEERCA